MTYYLANNSKVNSLLSSLREEHTKEDEDRVIDEYLELKQEEKELLIRLEDLQKLINNLVHEVCFKLDNEELKERLLSL